MDYQRLSDLELINIFLTYKPDKETIRDEIFNRYYLKFDQRIRAVLYTYGLPYSPDEFYYNEIFMEIYRKIFELPKFEEVLQKFNARKGNFGNWFLNYVVVNRTKDWLKKFNKTRGKKNLQWLKEESDLESRKLSFDSPINHQNKSLSFSEVLSVEKEEPDDDHRIGSAINSLPQAQRLMLRVLFVAYQEIPEQDLNSLTRETGKKISELKSELAGIADELKGSSKHEKSRTCELSLACLTQEDESWRKRLYRVEAELEALFPERSALETELTEIKLKELERSKQDLTQAYRENKIDGQEYHCRNLLLQRQLLIKRLNNTQKKKEKISREYLSGKYFVFPSYRKVAQLLAISEGTVASRINRTVSSLKTALILKENP